MSTLTRKQSSKEIVVIPGKPKSDGIIKYDKDNPPSRKRNWKYDEEEFKKIIGGALTKSWSDRENKTYMVQYLPQGYTFFSSKRDPPDNRVDYRFYGHPSGRPFDSKEQFLKHYKFIQARGSDRAETCGCKVCLEHPTTYIYLFDDHQQQVTAIFGALQERWKELAFRSVASWTDEEEEFAAQGIEYAKALKLRNMVLEKFDYGPLEGARGEDWDPKGCMRHFHKIEQLIKENITFAVAVAKGKTSSLRGIADDPEGWLAIMEVDADSVAGEGAGE